MGTLREKKGKSSGFFSEEIWRIFSSEEVLSVGSAHGIPTLLDTGKVHEVRGAVHLVVEFLRVGQRQLVPTHNKGSLETSHVEQHIYHCCGNVTIFTDPDPTFEKLRFRFRPLTSSGSGSSSVFTVERFSTKFGKALAFYKVSCLHGKN